MPAISNLLSVNVPRYTSYPTAPHFHPGVGASEYREWLQSLPKEATLSLYLHIPFCDTLCWFCGCNTTAVNSYAPVREYCTLLLGEIAMVSSALGRCQPVSHIHWGGGSPTLLSSRDIARISAELRACFDVKHDAEIAVEVDPRGLTQAMVTALREAGVTRASIGVQDCDPAVQKAVNRVQSSEDTSQAVQLLRNAGIHSLNLDLVYGLPRQTLLTWERTLDFALGLNPDRFAIFGYAHVPDFKRHQALIPVAELPGPELRFEQAKLARDILRARGYVEIGMDHYAKPRDPMALPAAEGKVARNFQGYTTDHAAALIGFGASAIGSLPKGYVQNLKHVPAYRDAILAGRLPVARGFALSDNDRIHRHIIERLMCDMEVDLGDVAALFGCSPAVFADSLSGLASIQKKGLIEISGEKIRVNPDWRSAVRLVCAVFDQYLSSKPARHSVSV